MMEVVSPCKGGGLSVLMEVVSPCNRRYLHVIGGGSLSVGTEVVSSL